MAQRNLQILITAKNQAQKQLNGLQGQVQKMQPAFQKMALAGTAAAGGMAFLGKKALDAAGNAEVIEGRFGAVYSNTQEMTNKWVNDLAKEYGRAESTMQSVASNVGGQLQMVAQNLPEEEISEMAKSLSEQSIAMSAYYPNLKNSADASTALSAALAGQTDRLTQMGYQVGKNSEQFDNMRKKMGFAKEEMNSTKEAQVIYSLITKQNKMVMDAYNETQDSYNEKMNQARERIKKASETLGNIFLPMAAKALDAIMPFIEKIGKWIEDNEELTKKIIIVTAAIAGIVAVVGVLGMALIPLIISIKALAAVLFFVASPIGLITLAVAALAAGLVYLYKKNETFRNIVNAVWEVVKWTIKKAIDLIVMHFNNVKKGINMMVKAFELAQGAFKTIWGAITSIFEKAKEKIMGFLNPIIETAEKVIDLASKVGGAVGKITGAAGNIAGKAFSLLPGRADGGPVKRGQSYVVGEEGPEVFTPNQSGRIISNGSSRGAGTTVNITVNGDISGDELIDKVKRGIMGDLNLNNNTIG